MSLTIIPSIILCFIIAELVGRSKHIGRWWSFFLLLAGVIPGVIALISSPSAKTQYTSNKNGHKIGSIIVLIIAIIQFVFFIVSNGKIGHVFIFLLLLSAYLFNLYKGNIYNKHPRFYYQEIREWISLFLVKNSKYKRQQNSITTPTPPLPSVGDSILVEVNLPPLPNINLNDIKPDSHGAQKLETSVQNIIQRNNQKQITNRKKTKIPYSEPLKYIAICLAPLLLTLILMFLKFNATNYKSNDLESNSLKGYVKEVIFKDELFLANNIEYYTPAGYKTFYINTSLDLANSTDNNTGIIFNHHYTHYVNSKNVCIDSNYLPLIKNFDDFTYLKLYLPNMYDTAERYPSIKHVYKINIKHLNNYNQIIKEERFNVDSMTLSKIECTYTNYKENLSYTNYCEKNFFGIDSLFTTEYLADGISKIIRTAKSIDGSISKETIKNNRTIKIEYINKKGYTYSTHTFEYDKNDHLIIKQIVNDINNYPIKPPKLKSYTRLTYKYDLDKYNNWITQHCFENGQFRKSIKRSINYYTFSEYLLNLFK